MTDQTDQTDQIELPRMDGTPFVVTPEFLDELRQRHPGVDVQFQLRKMRNWLDANPKRRKVDVVRFINNWLSKPGIERDVGRSSVPRAQSRHVAHVAQERERTRPRSRYYGDGNGVRNDDLGRQVCADLRAMLDQELNRGGG